MFDKYGLSDILSYLFPLLIGGGGISGIWLKLRSYLKNKLLNFIYKKRLKEIGLHE